MCFIGSSFVRLKVEGSLTAIAVILECIWLYWLGVEL